MKVVTFGEIMLRLNPRGYERFLQAESFVASYAGSEATVAVDLCALGVNAEFVTRVPAHEIGEAALGALRRYGVSVAHCTRGGERLGIYFLEKGASQRGGKVIYDRAGSAIATAPRDDFNWREILSGADWFHISGITPALSPTLFDACLDAVSVAKELGVTVSMDLNYRAKLWSYEQAREAYRALLPYVDYCKDPLDYGDGEADPATLASRMIQDFSLRAVAITNRHVKSASDHTWSATVYTADGAFSSREYALHVVDRVGGGDSFVAGWIYALLHGMPADEAVELATAASAIKHSIEGDYNLTTPDEVRALLAGGAAGRVQR